jgi:amino acid transporter
MTVMYIIAFVGFIVAMGILLFTSHDSFRSTVDSSAGNGVYAKTVAAGADSGLYPDDGYSSRSTIGAIYFILTVTMFTFWGTYLSAEFRRAGQRKRQLVSMVGAGLGQGLLVVIGAAIFLHTVGYDFFVSSLSGGFTGPGGGSVGQVGYVYFASLVAGGTFIVVVLSLAFLGWMLPAVNINMAFCQRALLTWSFDGLLPGRVSHVDKRTHTPTVAIALVLVITIGTAAWASYSTNFIQVFSIATLFAFFPVILTGLSAMVMKRRRPELYNGSPAEWRVGGIEILPIAGFGCLATGCIAVFLALKYHTELGLTHLTLTWMAPIFVFIAAAIWWLAARAERRSEGIDLDLVYKTIPPD